MLKNVNKTAASHWDTWEVETCSILPIIFPLPRNLRPGWQPETSSAWGYHFHTQYAAEHCTPTTKWGGPHTGLLERMDPRSWTTANRQTPRAAEIEGLTVKLTIQAQIAPGQPLPKRSPRCAATWTPPRRAAPPRTPSPSPPHAGPW